MKPFVKWAGGKRQILEEIIKQIKEASDGLENFTFYEPFVGGGIVFLTLANKKAVINDLNSELINCYLVIRDNPVELMKELEKHANNFKERNDAYYYEVREWDRLSTFKDRTNIEKAARTIFLNKTCYNGLYRVNLKGEFNTPVGRYVEPSLYNEANILEISNYLKKNKIKIRQGTYVKALRDIKEGNIVYLDPPYDYGDDDGFTQYQKEGFTFEDFKEMKKVCDECLDKGANVIISNNNTPPVIRLFESDPRYVINYGIKNIKTKRYINCKGNMRNTGDEIIIWGSPNTFPQANNIESLISLIGVSEENLRDFAFVRNKINVSTDRQVSYYISALKYLGIIDEHKKYTDIGKDLCNKQGYVFRVGLSNLIISKWPFNEIYDVEVEKGRIMSQSDISNIIRESNPKMSVATADRRASTVRAWLTWVEETLNKKVKKGI